MAKTPVSEQVQVNFRIPVPLRDRIKAVAEKNNRSMNAEIIARLEASFLKNIDTSSKKWADFLDEVDRMSRLNSSSSLTESADFVTIEIKINKHGSDE